MINAEEVSINPNDFNLEEFIKNATWREILIHLVDTDKLDPWDIDISYIVDKYTEFIKGIKLMNLVIPANMVLAASILLKIKSNTVSFINTEVETDNFDEGDSIDQDIIRIEKPDTEPLIFRLKPVKSRKITLNELLNALDQSIKKEIKKKENESTTPTEVQFLVKKEDINKKIEDTYELIKKNVDKYNLVSFNELASKFKDKTSILLDLFVPSLFLAKGNKITIIQDKFFGEIIFKLN